MSDAERRRISEARDHPMAGKPPTGFQSWRAFAESIPLYEVVDAELLYQGDPDPFHVTLNILEVDAVSANGLLYDEELVQAIEDQLPGKGGIRGHIVEGYEYPLDEVDWVGHTRVGKKTYAKGYIPPGQTREMVRRIMGRGGLLKTSFDGTGFPEDVNVDKGVWRLREFELNQLDLAHPNKAALRANQDNNLIITKQISSGGTNPGKQEKEDSEMSEVKVTLADVPEAVREQIIKEAKVKADAARVTELEGALAKTEAEIKELRRYSEIVGEIATVVDAENPTDVVGIVRTLQENLTVMAETLGVDVAHVSVRVNELHVNVVEMAKREFEHALKNAVAEFTNWPTVDDDQKARVMALQNSMASAIRTRLSSDKRDEAAIKETAQTVWDAEYKVLGDVVRQSLVGPSAFVGGNQSNGRYDSDGWIEERRKGVSRRSSK